MPEATTGRLFRLIARVLCGTTATSLRPFRRQIEKRLIGQSSSFDPIWYRSVNPDVRAAGVDPLQHYVFHGAGEQRDPAEAFDAEFYAAACPDLATKDISPVTHFELWGRELGRVPLWHGPPHHADTAAARREALGAMLKPDAADIAIGIVTYNNSSHDMARLLRSIALSRRSAQVRIRVMLIDNGDPVEFAPQADISRVESRGNIGFGAAHNVLMEKAFASGATHYLAANPDGCFHPECLEALLVMSQASGHRALVEALQFPDEHPKVYDFKSFDTAWASGCCLMIGRAVYERIGGFDPSFFMYCEDVDFSWRARNAGFAVKICPRALFMHRAQHRDYDVARHRQFLTSGLVLARKWGSTLFAERMSAELKKYKFDVHGIPKPQLQPDRNGVADFEHQFSFALRRWRV